MRSASEVGSGVFVATSRKMSTNFTILVGDGHALLVDPAWLPDELDAIAADINDEHLAVIGGFATHAHHDHLLWHPSFGSAPRWASEQTAALAVGERSWLVHQLGSSLPPHLVDLMGQVRGVPESIPKTSVPAGLEIELIVHNGHAPGDRGPSERARAPVRPRPAGGSDQATDPSENAARQRCRDGARSVLPPRQSGTRPWRHFAPRIHPR